MYNHINSKCMASINQLISEIAHSVKQADSIPVRRAIKLGIIHARNELIRHSYANHNYTDKVLQQRFKLLLLMFLTEIFVKPNIFLFLKLREQKLKFLVLLD